jgi:hypothetical protein
VYSDVERVSFKPRTEVRRSDRRQLLRTDGADPAVFADTEQNRALLSPQHREVEALPGYRQTIVSGLASDDAAMVDLWSAEMVLRPGTFSCLSGDEVDVVRAAAENPLLRPATRARLLLAAQDLAPAYGADWYIKSALATLRTTSIQSLGEQAGTGYLIYTALLIARHHPVPSAGPVIAQWLHATPPLAESAAMALRAIDPQLERDAVVAAIAKEKIPEPTRRMLVDHLRRLDRAQVTKQSHKEDSNKQIKPPTGKTS